MEHTSNKRALLEKIMPLCDLCKSCVTSHVANYQKSQNIACADIHVPCGTNFFRIQIFGIFAVFSRSAKKVPAKKIIPAKIYSIVEIYIQTSPFTCHVILCWCPFTLTVSFVQKENEIRSKPFRNKTMKLQSVHYKY